MPEKVPLWVVQNTFKTFGNRMPQRGDTLPDDLKICDTCQAELYKFVDWHYCDGKHYCTLHIDAARAELSKTWERERNLREASYHSGYRPPEHRSIVRLPGITEAIPRTESEVPAGNLDEYLYQYWIGVADEDRWKRVMSSRATCRACGEVVFGAIDRAEHKRKSTKLYVGEFSCLKVIAMAIRELAPLHNCLVCKNYTSKKHYGVPICSPNCHKIWRFSEKMQYPELELAIAPYWITSENTPATGGSSISESSLSQTPTVLLPGEGE